MHTGHFEDAVAVNAAATYVAPRPGGPANDNVYPLHNRCLLLVDSRTILRPSRVTVATNISCCCITSV